MNQFPLFSSGIELANLVVSSGLLKLSWDKISELYTELNQSEKIRCKVYEPPQSNCKIVAFVVSPNCTKQLLEEEELVPSSSLPFSLSHFLRPEINSSFSINKAAVNLFNSVHDQLSSFKDQLGNSISMIVTGHCLGGSVASLFTLWLLESINRPGTKRPLCITFGAPLIGDKSLQQAISQNLMWNSDFLHVAASQDLVPRFFISPYNPNAMEIDSQTGIYKPFGIFLLCSEYGCSSLEDPEAVSEVLVAMDLEIARNKPPNEQWRMIDYGAVVKRLISTVSLKGISQLSEMIECPLQAGIVLQLQAIGLNTRQQSGDSNPLIVKLEKCEKALVSKRKMVFNPFQKLNKRKVDMAKLEWYKKVSKSEDKGYYDSYKSGGLKKDMHVVTFKKSLTTYWKEMVAEVERMPQKEEASFRTRWLYAGTNYRRMVEPLDIADYYKENGKDYKANGRSQHYIKLEKWLEEAEKPLSSQVITRKQNVSASLTEDSCFWAHVEEALIQCELLRNGQEEESTRKKLIEFEEYVMEQIKEYAVSPEIFLGGSSFMQWWKDYEQIVGTSYKSQLTDFMKSLFYRQYH